MRQDLRELFREERVKKHELKEGHEVRFEERLKEAFPKRRKSNYYLFGMAASVVVLLGIGFVLYQQIRTTETLKTTVIDQRTETAEPRDISLGDLSPDLRKVETYYVNSINMELANLQLSPENKEVVDDFMVRLGELNEEYKVLNKELNEMGPNEQTIGALIKNLQLRLQLLLKLKEKLHQLKSSKNETVTTSNA